MSHVLLYFNLRTAAFPAERISGRHDMVLWGGRQHPIPLPALPEPPSRAEESRAREARGG